LREKLLAERFDLIDKIAEPLIDASRSLLVLSKSAIHAFEPLEHLAPHLLQSDHRARR
jgi:hypothetical protein